MSDKINANAPGYDAATPEYFYEQRIAELEKQLAERDAALARCVEALNEAAYALFQIKRRTPESIVQFSIEAHGKACEVLDSLPSSAQATKIIAEAKAEALEEAEATLGGTSEIIRKVDLRAKASEYRAKAKP